MPLHPSPLSSLVRSKRRKVFIDAINVTPFIDVMLVLLVVFMVTAPLLSVGLEVELPQSDAKPLHSQEEPLIVTIRHDGAIFLQEKQIKESKLIDKLASISAGNPNITIYIRGDRRLRYSKVLRVMGRISRAGFERVSLVTDPLR